MGDNIFSSGMEVIAIVAVILVFIIVLAVFLLPTIIQIFNEFSWIFVLGFILFMLLFGGVLMAFIKNLNEAI